jgi:hypothetical protein
VSYTPPPGAGVQLVFADPATGAQPVDLVFGAEGTGAPGEVLASLVATLPALTLQAQLGEPVVAALVATLPGLAMAALAAYSSDVQRPVVGQAQAAWQLGQGLQQPVANSMQNAQAQRTVTAPAWQAGQGLTTAVRVRLPRRLVAQRLVQADRFAAGARNQSAPARPGWANAVHDRRLRTVERFAPGLRSQSAPARPGWANALHDKRLHLRSSWQAQAQAMALRRASGMGSGAHRNTARHSPFQQAMRPPAGRSVWTQPGPVFDPCYLPDAGDAVALLFAQAPGSTALVFVCERHGARPPATVVVPARRVYLVINQLELIRLDTGQPVPCNRLTLSLDVDSWTHGVSASIPASALALVEPSAYDEPVVLQATINGTPWRWLAESIDRDRVFASSGLTVAGRGVSALLDAPYSGVMTFGAATARTAQQLAGDVLLDNGVPLGWALDWRPTDWLVPGGVWSHQGTRISALSAIASAAGATLQTHAADDTLIVLPRYPAAPWDWPTTTPDIELPAAVAQREGISWASAAQYNRVFVSGTTAGGVLGQVTRALTAGDQVAPMVTDALITHADAARQRGLQVLAAGGRTATVSLRMPVLSASGILRPGQLVRYLDGSSTRHGLVRGNSVEANGVASVWQTVSLESHEFLSI